MGLSDNNQRDAEEFKQRNPVVRYLVEAGFRYSELDEIAKGELQRLMTTLIEESKGNCPDPAEKVAFGWKRAITTFTCEIFLDAYPEAKTVHLIRDGRDAMLSRLQSRMRNLHDPFNRLVVFGDPSISEFHGKCLTREVVDRYRNEIEMHHWVTVVSFGMRARKYGDRYLEVKYEDLCEYPEKTLSRVFEFLEVPFLDESREWTKANASTASIGKWKGREEELRDAIQIGTPLLTELGYV